MNTEQEQVTRVEQEQVTRMLSTPIPNASTNNIYDCIPAAPRGGARDHNDFQDFDLLMISSAFFLPNLDSPSPSTTVRSTASGNKRMRLNLRPQFTHLKPNDLSKRKRR